MLVAERHVIEEGTGVRFITFGRQRSEAVITRLGAQPSFV